MGLTVGLIVTTADRGILVGVCVGIEVGEFIVSKGNILTDCDDTFIISGTFNCFAVDINILVKVPDVIELLRDVVSLL